jgi:RNA polymerase sigma-B factor
MMQATVGSATDRELLELARSRPAGDPGRDVPCEELVRRYSNIVRGAVARYRDSPESGEDLAQVGYLGLMKAINGFDPDVGESFAAYAAPCVNGEIKRHFRDRRWQVRVQRPAQELRLRIRAAAGELTQRLSRTPTAAELADSLGVSEDQVNDAQLAAQAFQVASLDAPAAAGDDAGPALGDLVGAEDPALERTVELSALWHHYDELPGRQQRMLMMRFWGNMTQAEIADRLGISQMHVSRLLTRALDYLHDKIDGDPEPAA